MTLVNRGRRCWAGRFSGPLVLAVVASTLPPGAAAWRLTGDKAFLKQSERYLDAWVSTYQITFNPIDEGRFDGLDPVTSTRTYLLASMLDPRWKDLSHKLSDQASQSTDEIEPGERLDWPGLLANFHEGKN